MASASKGLVHGENWMLERPMEKGFEDPDDIARSALAHLFRRPFTHLKMAAAREKACEERDLVDMGWVVFGGLVAVARGEALFVNLAYSRLPYRGEFREAASRIRSAYDYNDARVSEALSA